MAAGKRRKRMTVRTITEELSGEDFRALIEADMSEETFLQQVKHGARSMGRLTYHTRQVAQCPRCHGPAYCGKGCRTAGGAPQRAIAMGSDPGFPDLVLPVPPVLHLAELKTVDGALSPEQERWLEAIRSCRAVEAHVWRPGDTARIQEVLIGGARAEL